MPNKSSRQDGYNLGFTANSGNSGFKVAQLDSADVQFVTLNTASKGSGSNGPFLKAYVDGTTASPALQTLTTAPPTGLACVAYGWVNGAPMWVALTNSTTITAGALQYSLDGKNWVGATLPSAPGGAWTSIAFGNGRFVATAATTTTTSGIAYSYDGINWAYATTVAPGGNWANVRFGGVLGKGIFCAVATANTTSTTVATSPDGITWTFQTSVVGAGNYTDCAWGNPLNDGSGMWLFTLLGTTTNTTVYKSVPTGGTLGAFSAITLPTAPLTTGPVSVVFGNNVGVSAPDNYITATGAISGTTLTLATPNSQIMPGSFVYGAGVSANTLVTNTKGTGLGTIYSVTPSQTVSSTALSFDYPQNQTPYTGMFLVVCGSTAVTNGVMFGFNGTTAFNIMPPITAPASAWIRVGYGQGVFFALSGSTTNASSLASSIDGVTWNMLTPPTAPGGAWKNLCAGDNRSGLLVLVANAATVNTSLAMDFIGPALMIEYAGGHATEGYPDLFITANAQGFSPDMTKGY